jgi:NDP-sugar pyrophosphorylase family protein
MRVIILAGGMGTRLRPYTVTLPKPLVPVGNRSILDIVLLQLRYHGVQHVTMAVNNLSHLIMAYFGDGKRWGITIDYSIEDTPLSTIGPLTLIKNLPENFLVMNGDILTDLNFTKLFKHHSQKNADITVAICKRDSKIDFGVIQTDENHHIVGFEEKPVLHHHVSMGVYALNRRLLDIVPHGVPFGFDELMVECLKKNCTVLGFPHQGDWLDIGRPDDYQEANDKIDQLITKLLPENGAE